ncbi:MAG: MurR/RpiR family transcriptional regulator [Variovorax sp.]
MRTDGPSGSAAEHLLAAMASEFVSLSRQLKLIARYVEQHQGHIGLDRIQDVADRCGVQPSAVIRFAKHFGFSGYSEMRKIFRDGLAQQMAPDHTDAYQARIRGVIEAAEGPLSSADIADAFIGGSIAGMHQLKRDLHSTVFDEAVDLLVAADTVWVVGAGRSFPVAAYLTYALQHTDKRVEFVTGLGGMNEGQLRGLRPRDVVLVVSFAPYADESLNCSKLAVAAGAKLVAITDSRLNALAGLAFACLVVEEASTFGFRSLSNTLCLAQSLFIALAYRCELLYKPTGDGSGPAAAATAAEKKAMLAAN